MEKRADALHSVGEVRLKKEEEGDGSFAPQIFNHLDCSLYQFLHPFPYLNPLHPFERRNGIKNIWQRDSSFKLPANTTVMKDWPWPSSQPPR